MDDERLVRGRLVYWAGAAEEENTSRLTTVYQEDGDDVLVRLSKTVEVSPLEYAIEGAHRRSCSFLILIFFLNFCCVMERPPKCQKENSGEEQADKLLSQASNIGLNVQ